MELTGVAQRLANFSDAAQLDLARLGTTADAAEITDTAITQPLVVAAALIASGVLDLPERAVAAGHSIGEFAAASIAGVIDAEQAVRLSALRGRAMRDACELTPTSMAACMNPDSELVLAALAERNLVGANVNGAGQVVAAGARADIDALVADPPEKVRVIGLQVAGAFHTVFMTPAQTALAPQIAAASPADPRLQLLTNRDGSVIASGREYLDLVLGQITAPVRWDLCMAAFSDLGVTGVLELPPAGTLVGLIKRDRKDIATLALKTPADLDAAAAFIADHAGAPA